MAGEPGMVTRLEIGRCAIGVDASPGEYFIQQVKLQITRDVEPHSVILTALPVPPTEGCAKENVCPVPGVGIQSTYLLKKVCAIVRLLITLSIVVVGGSRFLV